jgi:ATP-binding cassette, subfamily B, bacterial
MTRADFPARRAAATRAAAAAYGRQLRIDKRMAIPALLLPGIGNICTQYLPPLVVARVLYAFGRANGQRITVGSLAPYIVLFALVWLAGELVWRVGIHFLNRAAHRGVERLYLTGMDSLLQRDLAFFHDNFGGALTKKLVSYSKSFEQFLDTCTFAVAANTLPLFFAVIVLWRFSVFLPLVLIGGLSLTLLFVMPLIRRRQKLVDAREEASTEVAGHIADSITNMEAVRAFAREPFEAEVHLRKVRHYSGLMLRSWDYQNRVVDLVTTPMYVLTNLIGVVIAIAVGQGGLLSLQAVFVTFSYFAISTRVVWDFNQIYRNLESTIAEAAQFTDLLLDDPTVVDVEDAPAFTPVDASVRFEHVRFRYPNTSEPLFENFNLHIAAGEKVGLVGRSGGGKTTISRLVLRLMDIEGGHIRIGGQDIASVWQADVRDVIAYVPQDPVMFHRSLRDNIAFGRLDATDAEVEAAARAAHAAEFIEDLPDGYATMVGERGIKLSGGQRQRIAIARAVVRQAPILVLDEATSSLDSESEALIQLALRGLMERSTAIVIAHRLSTVQQMDRLVVIDQGAVIEEGNHAQLIRNDSIYAGLWARQSGGFLQDLAAS